MSTELLCTYYTHMQYFTLLSYCNTIFLILRNLLILPHLVHFPHCWMTNSCLWHTHCLPTIPNIIQATKCVKLNLTWLIQLSFRLVLSKLVVYYGRKKNSPQIKFQHLNFLVKITAKVYTVSMWIYCLYLLVFILLIYRNSPFFM